ncbi:bifunctional phosphopantothenoylcysteine decarboxylase/phosphopantothenate synthase [Rothia halotolerans]|uniref:bifunctional phosphopantothenoylcysteine decarboxylase/phosphopantothenate synthase n=1 Tax=Rothia halotolerans TaxID=405770 RepID=UPI00101C029F|nr:bifunctional phosphopantothenoylcysteine decarboxylase/phosphopantothenate synthase [Rothia halotolerans]
MRIILGIGGGIAAYKAAMLLRLFSEAGHDVVPMPTDSALRFVGAPTFEALSGHPVRVSVFEDVETVNHVRQGEQADLIVVAPATADLLARLAAGRADDLLTGTVLTATCPVVIAPAMHTQMWENPATRRNVEILRGYGYTVVEPAVGRLTGRDSGAGRLPEPAEIRDAALAAHAGTRPRATARTEVRPQTAGHAGPRADDERAGDRTPGGPRREGPLGGRRVVVTAGGTREPLDPVRFLGNRSSGKQGIAVARAALDAGAEVTLLLAHTEVPAPAEEAGLTIRSVGTALELREAVFAALAEQPADALVMTAAVADFRPGAYRESKIKKDPEATDAPVIELVRNPDILREVVQRRGEGGPAPALIVGFAAETGSEEASVAELGRAKLCSKGSDVLVVNQVGTDLVFGSDRTAATILVRRGSETEETDVAGGKDDLARRLVELMASHPDMRRR